MPVARRGNTARWLYTIGEVVKEISTSASKSPSIDSIKKKGENFISVFVVMSVPMMEV